MEINIPDVLQEVTDTFWRYDAAVVGNDVAVLNELFWDSPHTLRFGFAEHLYGHAEIASFRSNRTDAPLSRKVTKLVITTYGWDFGTANCETLRTDTGLKGRQSHSWARMPEGWRIVAAHVSAPNA